MLYCFNTPIAIYTNIGVFMQPLRVTKKQACELLAISGEQLRKLIHQDKTFPKPYKTGSSRQSAVYFDYADLLAWHNQQKGNA